MRSGRFAEFGPFLRSEGSVPFNTGIRTTGLPTGANLSMPAQGKCSSTGTARGGQIEAG